jgi:hypothetical protein
MNENKKINEGISANNFNKGVIFSLQKHLPKDV